MKRTIFVSTLVIVLVIVLTAAATWAYFTGSKTEKATITTANIDLDETWNFPLEFKDMLPGEQLSREFAVRNTGTRDADFYFQMIGEISGEMNFCFDTHGNPKEVLDIAIYDRDTGVWYYNDSICPLYPGRTNSTIVKIGENVAPGAWKNLTAYITLDPLAGNEYQNGSNTDTVHLIAIQYNGPSPVPDKDGFPEMKYWPDDEVDSDADTNYP